MKSNKRKQVEAFSRTKEQHASLKALCDDESSSDYSIDSSSDKDIVDKSKAKKSSQFLMDNEKTSKDNSNSDKYRHNEKNKSISHYSMKNKKIRENILRKDQDSDSSDSIIHQKSKQKKVKLCREEAESSSGKEFTQSKILHSGSKKLMNSKENRLISTAKSTMQKKDDAISKKHSLLFKSNIVKILNKFKEICSDYELRMEHVKWKHFKKEILCREAASKVIKKSGAVIDDFKQELETQERNLIKFYEEWKTVCEQQDSDHEDSSQTEEEKKITPIDKSGSDSSNTVFSDCDKEIFSQAETQDDEDKKIEDIEDKLETTVEKSMNDTLIEESHSKSPVLGHNREKDTEKRMSPMKDDSLNETEKTEDECANKSQDMFNESADITAKSEEEKNEYNENNTKDSNTNIGKDNLRSDETLACPKKDQKNVILSSTNEGNLSDEIDEENQAKKALLESDSDSFMDDNSIIEASITEECNKIDDLKRKVASQTLKLDKKNTSVCKDSFPSEQREIMIEENAKRALLESNSDDSDTKSSSTKKQDSDNSEFPTDNRLKKNKIFKKKDKDSYDSSDDSTSKSDSELKIKKKVSAVNKKRTSRSLIGNFDSSDKMFSCKVVIERLPEKELEKYKDALEKSRQYLENKEDSREFRSLIDLDRLEKNRKRERDSSRNSPRTAAKSKKKEEKETLMDHLKKVEKGEFENIGEDFVAEGDSLMKPESNLLSNETLIKEADAMAKKMLLYSSDSDTGEQNNFSESNDEIEEEDKKKENKSKSKDSSNKSKSNKEEEDSDKENEKQKKSRWKQDKLLRDKISSDSDSNTVREKWEKKQDKLKKQEDNHGEDSQNDDSIVKRKRRNRRKIVDSDSDVEMNSETQSGGSITSDKSIDSDSSVSKQKKKKKRKDRQSSTDSDISIAEIRSKPKRRRIKNVSSTDSDESENDLMSSQGTPGKKGRKNIRKVMKDKLVADDTKQAAKEEEERLKRIAERQKVYNELYESRLATEEKVDKLVLDFDPETKKELVAVNQNLVKHLKPHQAKGIKFMWDSCFESLERMKSSQGSGCIIAHCMGLGKTLQVIALAHTLLAHDEMDIKTILVVTPLNTVLNWKNEFDLWLKDLEDDDVNVYELTKLKKNIERMYHLQQWQRTGGVLVIGYEMFRNLCGTNNRLRKTMKEEITKCLLDPGPDMIVCDEGHLLKNEDTALSKSITKVRTSRRIVLTGTPLQNNLSEYHCMVQFVKPKLLGTRKEFLNRFVNPINNGQYDDSTEYDVKLMKKRAYVLHKMLKGCVQRCDYSVLMPFLPPKQEYVIFVNLTEVQIKMYRYYLDNLARRQNAGAGGCLFADFQSLQRIWTHPMVMRLNAERVEKANERKLESESEGSLKNFINDNSDDESTSSDDDVQSIDSKASNKPYMRNTRNNKNASPIVLDEDKEEPTKKEEDWWMQFVQEEYFEDMRISSKLMLLFGILSECEKLGDKVLVFSQSLYSLTLIEQFLNHIDDATQTGATSTLINGHTGSWSLGLDYFRLDGQTSADNRNRWCKIFNRPTNTRARLFLISTRAGGLGINLTAANRVIIFDASWNPSHDVQSIFRVYRFGQKKPCFVYRLLAAGTMEEKIYNRQVTKLSLSCRVIDEQQIERHFSNNNLSELYSFEPKSGSKRTLSLPRDRLLAEILLKYKDNVENYLEHDSLLENKAGEELDEEERKLAWLEYEEEKKGKPIQMPAMPIPNFQNMGMFNLPGLGHIDMPMEYSNLQELIRKDYPNSTPEQQQMLTTRALGEMYNYFEKETISRLHQSANTNRMNQMNAGQRPQIVNTTMQMINTNQMRTAQMAAQVQNVNTNQMQSRVQLPNARPYVTSKYMDSSSVTRNPRQEVLDDDVVEVISNTIKE